MNPAPDPCDKRQRFLLLCRDLFDRTTMEVGADPVLRAASKDVMAVETGRLARRHIRRHLDESLPGMPAEDRAFAAGLALGFMTEFLPRREG